MAINSIDYGWDGNRLKKLREATGFSIYKISEKLKVRTNMLHKFERNEAVPTMKTLIRISNFFGVPIDYLMSRTDYQDIEKVFKEKFDSLKKSRILEITKHDNKIPSVDGMWVPYPYNLIGSILGEHDNGLFLNQQERERLNKIAMDVPAEDREFLLGLISPQPLMCLSEGQKRGLAKAMSSLSEREQFVIECRFKDNMTLEEIGKMKNITRERVRQILAKAIRKLRHPSRSKKILWGVNEYEKEIKRIDDTLHEYREKTKILEEEIKQYNTIQLTKLEDCNLSRRPFIILQRAGILHLEDLMDKTEDEIMQLRGMGLKSCEEIKSTMAEFGIGFKEN